LLGDGAHAFDAVRSPNTVDYSPDKPDGINAEMAVEASIFRGDERVDQNFWNLSELDDPALFARLVEQIRHYFRRKPCFIGSFGFRDQTDNAGDGAFLKIDSQRVADDRVDRNAASAHLVRTVRGNCFIGRLETGALQTADNRFGRQLLPRVDTVWGGVDSRRVFENLAAELPVNDSGVLDVEVNKGNRSGKEGNQENRQRDLEDRCSRPGSYQF
jgi:hypothetical protein